MCSLWNHVKVLFSRYVLNFNRIEHIKLYNKQSDADSTQKSEPILTAQPDKRTSSSSFQSITSTYESFLTYTRNPFDDK